MAQGNSETFKIQCACGGWLRIPNKARGKKVKCPKCDAVFVAEDDSQPFEISPLDTYDEDSPLKSEPLPASPTAPPVSSPPAKPGTPCPLCGKTIATGAVMCVACGYDTRTGRRLSTKKASVSAVAQLAKGAGTFLLGCVLSGIGALIGAAIWLAIGIFTKYEIGWIAWVLGFFAGAGMALGYRQYNMRAGVTAAAIALVGILLGKGAFFLFLVYALATGNTKDVQLLRGHLVERQVEEELNKRSVWDAEERMKQAPAIAAEAIKRVERMKDSEVERIAQGYRDEEGAQAEQFTDVGLLRTRIALHEAEREAEAKGLNWNDEERNRIADRHERRLHLLPESQLKVREKELNEWEKDGRFADHDYVHDRLVYEFVEDDFRSEPPPELAEMVELETFEWDVPDKIWKEYHKTALQDVNDLNSEERVAKLKEMEQKRGDNQIRDRLAHHRSELQANRDGMSPYDWEAHSKLTNSN